MPLPTGRNTTYAAGVDVESADMNDLQDQIIGAKHGPRRKWFPFTLISSAGHTVNPYYADNEAAGHYIHFLLCEGDRITDIDCVLVDVIGSVTACKMVLLDTSTGGTDETRTPVNSDNSGNIQEVPLPEDLPYTLSADETMGVLINPSNANAKTYGIWVTFEHP